MFMRLRMLFSLLTVVCLIVGSAALRAEIPQRVNVSLPVAAATNGETLEPGAYTIAIENVDSRGATLRFYRGNGDKPLLSVAVKAGTSATPASRTALRVAAKGSGYVLDSLLLAGESVIFEFAR